MHKTSPLTPSKLHGMLKRVSSNSDYEVKIVFMKKNISPIVISTELHVFNSVCLAHSLMQYCVLLPFSLAILLMIHNFLNICPSCTR